MLHLSRTLLMLLAPLAAVTVSAQVRHDSSRSPVAAMENVTYAFAQVTRVDPIYETVRTRTPEEVCDGRAVQQPGNVAGGTVVGALVGAALGNQVGQGDGRDAATVAGAVIGGAVGRNIARNETITAQPGCRIVEVEREQRRVAAYDVEYVHQGKTYMSRMPFDPGDRVRVRVTVQPVDEIGSLR